MSHPLQSAYDMYVEKLNKLSGEEVKVKKMLNEFAVEMKIKVPFPDVSESTIRSMAIHHDDFVGKSGSVAVGDYLDKRGNAAKWEEIKEALTVGGYDWSKYGTPKKTRLTILKNTFTFKYIKSSDAFGLKKWYPEDKKPLSNVKHNAEKMIDEKLEVDDSEQNEPNNKNDNE